MVTSCHARKCNFELTSSAWKSTAYRSYVLKFIRDNLIFEYWYLNPYQSWYKRNKSLTNIHKYHLICEYCNYKQHYFPHLILMRRLTSPVAFFVNGLVECSTPVELLISWGPNWGPAGHAYRCNVFCVDVFVHVIAYLVMFRVVELNKISYFCYRSWMFKLRCHCFVCLFICFFVCLFVCLLGCLFVCLFFTFDLSWSHLGILLSFYFCLRSLHFFVSTFFLEMLYTLATFWFKGVLHPWALFLKTRCIFSKNKATSDKVSYGSGQKCSKEPKNSGFTSVETIVVKLH